MAGQQALTGLYTLGVSVFHRHHTVGQRPFHLLFIGLYLIDSIRIVPGIKKGLGYARCPTHEKKKRQKRKFIKRSKNKTKMGTDTRDGISGDRSVVFGRLLILDA